MLILIKDLKSWRLLPLIFGLCAVPVLITIRNPRLMLKLGLTSSEDSSEVTCTEYLQYATSSQSEGDRSPQIAWLMSFPNSGTSYTLDMVHSTTKTLTATNYGGGLQKRASVPVFDDQPEGPFWITTTAETPLYAIPDKYVLAKTHCGGYCFVCPLQAQSSCSFTRKCLSGRRFVLSENNTLALEPVTYPPHRVKKAIHLIRDPFDNVVSRYHLALNNGMANASSTSDQAGAFRRFCTEMNEKHETSEKQSRMVSADILEISKIIPCRSDFIRYVAWHNLAFQTTRDLRLDTMTFYYDQYKTDFRKSVARIVQFLESEINAPPADFEVGKEYRNVYYSADEREAVHVLIQHIASQETWSHLQRFFM